MPAQLVSLDNDASIMLDKPILLLGRHPECDVQIDSRKISRRHCCIAQVADYLVVRDLGSTNGVRINGARVSEGKLVPGDELTIGNNRYQITWDSLPANARLALPAKVGAAAQAKGRAAAPIKPRQLADELLEECDDPVPLADDDDDVPLIQRTPQSPPSPMPAPDNRNGDEPYILPDDLQLAPRSDIFPPSAGHAP